MPDEYKDEKLVEIIRKQNQFQYGQDDKPTDARFANYNIPVKLKINEGHESWICKEDGCGETLVKDLNGDRAKITMSDGNSVVVKYTEMATVCKKCDHINILTPEHILNEAEDIDDVNEYIKNNKSRERLIERDTLLWEDYKRAQKEKAKTQKLKEIILDYWLKIK